jgi:hypothetical protein
MRKVRVADQYITPLEFAQQHGLHYTTALAHFRKPGFPSVKVGGQWKARRKDIHAYFKENTRGKARNGNVPT